MKITIMGGDERILSAGEYFKSAGCDCIGYGFEKSFKPTSFPKTENLKEALNNSTAVLLPLPWEKDGFLNAPFSKNKITFRDITENCETDTVFLGGKIKETQSNIIDYSTREDFQIFNAVPTAEGAVEIAIRESKKTLKDSKAVISGYGRIGSYLAELLKAFGTEVWVMARSPKNRAQAVIRGYKAVGFENYEAPLSNADMVFNTVPCRIFSPEQLSILKEDCLIIDLASLPGGVLESDCKKANVKLIRALGLPGKTAPETAGRIIFETAKDILSERGINI